MLVLIESPYKIGALQPGLNQAGYPSKVIATKGRLLDLPKERLAIDESFYPTAFEPVNPGHYSKIESLIRSESEVVIATDPDEEGDFIAWTIKLMRGDQKPTFRLRLYDYTPKSISSGFDSLEEVPVAPPRSLARRVFDRIAGFERDGTSFLSRPLGVLVSRALNGSLSPRFTIEKEAIKQGTQFDIGMRVGSLQSTHGRLHTSQDESGVLPSLVDAVEFGQTIGAGPIEVYDALQSLYESGEISYFRTTSHESNSSARESIRERCIEFRKQFLLPAHQPDALPPHPGIYATQNTGGADFCRESGRLDKQLLRAVFDATIMAGDATNSRRVHDRSGGRAAIQISRPEGNIFLPAKGGLLFWDALSNTPAIQEHHSSRLGKAGIIFRALSESRVGHPGSWKALCRSYSRFIDSEGRLSTLGVNALAFIHKRSPALLDLDISRKLEATLLDERPSPEKVKTALDIAGLSIRELSAKLEPSSGPSPEFGL